MIIHSGDMQLMANHTNICSILSCVSVKSQILILFWRKRCLKRQLQQIYVAVVFIRIDLTIKKKKSDSVVVVVSIDIMFSKMFSSVSPGNV